MVKRFGILTSGGDAPGLNAAIRAICMTAKRNYGMEAVAVKNGYHGLVHGDMELLDMDDTQGLLTLGGTILGTSREKPFKNPVPDPESGMLPVEAIRANYEKWNLDALVCLGGNGTNTTASKLAEVGLNVVGLPKTIDNDIVKTDVTFGFHTAVDVATDAIDRIHTTGRSHGRVMIVEVMGHKAGWLGLYSGISGGADVILIPEIPYNVESIAKKLSEREKEGKNYSVVVVAEGAKNPEESRMSKKEFKNARTAMQQSIGYRVSQELSAMVGLESRVSVLGYLQRGGSPSPYDRLLATQFGAAAADFLARGDFGKLVAMRNGEIVAVPLKDIAGLVKNVPSDSPLIESARGLGICFGD